MNTVTIEARKDGRTKPGVIRRVLSLLAGLPPSVLFGGAIVLFWLVTALTVQFWPLHDPLALAGRRLQPPSADHWLGTDALGRDVLSRTLHGAIYSMPIATIVVLAGVVIGAALGAIAGYVGGKVDAAIMRLVDITVAFPPILLAMTITATLGPGIVNAAIAMIIVWWPIYARLMRAQVLEVKEREHVEAAIAGGAGHIRILGIHILPLCWAPILINATMDFGQVVLLAASLSFVGLGATPPTPEWGSMIYDGASRFYSWWIAFGPGMAILTLVLGFSFLGDGLRDYFDPKSQ
ncbi:ABC transporter permease [Paracoccus litorisediminis]|uniref:ABC transporter permease subunit n=1 Tax=Paracoccus litorisediminis TaxID=2006130 RepID=A0A844HRM2_9RHOB|nr:ABC transporter permease [Paracoccus litorisediminis]MTH62486.1 ABC transporter permease subunit [Paracoccus litorisediminis]